jgi:hypothetical protein
VRSRRAIRSISHYSPTGFRGWFRYYPSRQACRWQALKLLRNWGKLVYVSKSAAFILKIKRSEDFENKTSEK